MKIKKLCFTILFILMIYSPILLAAQERTAVLLNKTVGSVLDSAECAQYELFKNFSNLISVRFYELIDGNYEINIQYTESGQQQEQVWYITRDEFEQDYMSILNPLRTSRRMDKKIHPGDQLIKVGLGDNRTFRGTLKEIDNDALRLIEMPKRGGSGSESELEIPINKIVKTSIVRTENAGKAIGIGMIPGVVFGLIGLLSGDDEPGFLSFSAEGKGMLGFMVGGFIGLNISGTITAMRSVDFDIPLESKTDNEKIKVFQQIYQREVPKQLRFRINPWFAMLTWKNDSYDGGDERIIGYMPGIRAKIYFTPRSGVEFSYGSTSQFNKKFKYYDYDYDPVSGTSTEGMKNADYNVTYFSGGYFIALTRDQIINPSFSWGWGYFRDKDLYDFDREEESLALHFKIGLEHYFNKWISVETRIGPITDFDRIYLTGELGISLGKLY